MELIKIKVTVQKNDYVQAHVTAKNDKGEFIFGLSKACPKSEFDKVLADLIASLDTSQTHVANPEKFGEGHI